MCAGTTSGAGETRNVEPAGQPALGGTNYYLYTWCRAMVLPHECSSNQSEVVRGASLPARSQPAIVCRAPFRCVPMGFPVNSPGPTA